MPTGEAVCRQGQLSNEVERVVVPAWPLEPVCEGVYRGCSDNSLRVAWAGDMGI